MPYSTVEEAIEKHPNLKKYTDKAQRGWISAFNSSIESDKDESYAFAVAYSAANKIDGIKSIQDKQSSTIYFSSFSEALQFLSDYNNSTIKITK